MTEAPPIAIVQPMTADEVRLELLAQVLILGVAVAEARRRVEVMTLGDGVMVPTLAQCYRLVKAAKRDGAAQKIRKQWESAQARKRKDHEAALKAEALRLVVTERVTRRAAAERLGLHYNTVTRWLTEPDAIEALMGEARVSAMMGALSLDDDIAK
ncbi:MAG: helix-turn-helix domain-containing protein, partial [Myxococcales bacterium]|nr:helix-turn-helix domain-containing protein [Myxococcales bacterium]